MLRRRAAVKRFWQPPGRSPRAARFFPTKRLTYLWGEHRIAPVVTCASVLGRCGVANSSPLVENKETLVRRVVRHPQREVRNGWLVLLASPSGSSLPAFLPRPPTADAFSFVGPFCPPLAAAARLFWRFRILSERWTCVEIVSHSRGPLFLLPWRQFCHSSFLATPTAALPTTSSSSSRLSVALASTR